MQVCPAIISSGQISSARLNLQAINPPNSSTSSSSAEIFRSSSMVDGAWVEEAKEDGEASEEVRNVRNIIKIPLFSPNFS